MATDAHRPVLVTGSHRSGSTWVGSMLALSPEFGYIHEPFNPARGDFDPGAVLLPVDHWFEYITAENEERYVVPMRRVLRFSTDLREGSRWLRSPGGAKRLVTEMWRRRAMRHRDARPLLKDPIAVLSAQWLAMRFGVMPVVLIRHPAAFASSLIRLGWSYDFSNFSSQPRLMTGLLAPFEAEIRRHARSQVELLDQATLLWRVIYHVVDLYRQQHPDWVFLRHEDLSRDPEAGFAALFARLGIRFSDEVRAEIRRYSDSSNPAAPARGAMDVRRDSRSVVHGWQRTLSREQITSIRRAVEDVSHRFYGDADWASGH